MRPGTRSRHHPRVGHSFIVKERQPRRVGTCVSVTYWGSNKVRWMRLRFPDGTEKSFAPSHLWEAGVG